MTASLAISSGRTTALIPGLNDRPAIDAVWETYIELGDNAYRKGFFDIAEKMFAAALRESIAAEHFDEYLGSVLCRFGRIYLQQDRVKKAEVFLKRSVDTFIRDKRIDDPAFCEALSLLGKVSGMQGRYEQAEKLFKKQFGIVKRAHGKSDSRLMEPLLSLINLYRTYGKTERAEALTTRLRQLKLDPNSDLRVR